MVLKGLKHLYNNSIQQFERIQRKTFLNRHHSTKTRREQGRYLHGVRPARLLQPTDGSQEEGGRLVEVRHKREEFLVGGGRDNSLKLVIGWVSSKRLEVGLTWCSSGQSQWLWDSVPPRRGLSWLGSSSLSRDFSEVTTSVCAEATKILC